VRKKVKDGLNGKDGDVSQSKSDRVIKELSEVKKMLKMLIDHNKKQDRILQSLQQSYSAYHRALTASTSSEGDGYAAGKGRYTLESSTSVEQSDDNET